MVVAIVAATGAVGQRVARQVAANGDTPLLIGRSTETLKRLAVPGARIAAADVSNIEQLVAASREAEALLWLVPPPPVTVSSLQTWQDQITAAALVAVRYNNIQRVVLISGLGAGAASGLGIPSYAAESEAAFNTLSADVLALRPGYFMENLLAQAGSLRAADVFSFPFAASHNVPLVSTNDIGDVAVRYLLDTTWAGHWTRNVMGPENLTPMQLASRLTVALGRPIHYHSTSVSELEQQLIARGFNSSVRREYHALFAALVDQCGVYAAPRTPEAYSPTTIEDFVDNKLRQALAEQPLKLS